MNPLGVHQRFVPELQVLSARAVASALRDLPAEQRARVLHNMPATVRPLVLAFPVSVFHWFTAQKLHQLPPSHIRSTGRTMTELFRNDCAKGYIFSKVVPRQCLRRECTATTWGAPIPWTKHLASGCAGLCASCASVALAKVGPRVKLLNQIRRRASNP